MHEMIDLCPYLPESPIRSEQTPPVSAPPLLLALEAVVTAIIGVSIVIGIGAFLLML